MNLKKLLLTAIMVLPVIAFSQVTFTNSNSLLVNSSLTSGVAIGVSDMNGDGLDDIVRLHDASSLQIEYQTAGGGNFTQYNYGSTGSSHWGLAIADVDKNGFNDVVIGGYNNGVRVLKASSNGATYSSTTLNGTIFLQNVNFADMDNNGTIDIFACHDNGTSLAYNNDGSGNYTIDNAGLINAVSTVPSDNSGNYGSIWTDYDNDGDQDLYISKCRLGVTNANDGRRINLLFQNDGNGNYTDVAVAAGLVPYGQSWSANFEDIDNDGDLDCIVINHDINSVIYENNGNGTFSDITASSGISSILSGMGSGGIQIIMEDFDNDTFIDLFVTARSGSHHMFKNNGNKTFTEMPSPFTLPTGPSRIQSAAVGDLNNDGFMDVVAGFANGYNGPSNYPDVLYFNDGNSNNWSEIRLRGNTSNINGIGARIELYGSWGKQIREVRSGESYGTMNSLLTHFGLGSATSITKIKVLWPSGEEDEILNPAINTSIEIIEGSTLTADEYTDLSISIYPNPTSNYVTVSTPNNNSSIAYSVYDISGKAVITQQDLNTSKQIDLKSLTSGIYFIHLEEDGKTQIQRIVKS
ncbi:FG-GAP-like repeat-containing protein [Hanstruepera marina]|uniref:FG-GAP-like repeat-containing protein n=1 Tax=Hanstruepera marina TaxID=2873265 RepID=UPI001CA7774E|nr:FG-GAP-like repeat-containing protein [Hanstruepera marina]